MDESTKTFEGGGGERSTPEELRGSDGEEWIHDELKMNTRGAMKQGGRRRTTQCADGERVRSDSLLSLMQGRAPSARGFKYTLSLM